MSFFCPGFGISCFGTTRFSGTLWSGLAFLILGPHAFPEHCGLVLRFLLWDHMPFRDAVVWPCASYLGTTCFSGALWSGLAFLILGPHAFPERCGLILRFLLWDHIRTGNTDFSQYIPAALLLLAGDCPRPSPVKPLRCILRHIGIGSKEWSESLPHWYHWCQLWYHWCHWCHALWDHEGHIPWAPPKTLLFLSA